MRGVIRLECKFCNVVVLSHEVILEDAFLSHLKMCPGLPDSEERATDGKPLA